MPESKEVSRRIFLKLVAMTNLSGVSATNRIAKSLEEFSSEGISKTDYIQVDEKIIGKFSIPFPQHPQVKEEQKRPPGLASINHILKTEKTTYPEIYQDLLDHPYIGFSINGEVITNVYGEGVGIPSYRESVPLSLQKEDIRSVPDFDSSIYFRCIDAGIYDVDTATQMITENPRDDILYIQTCYPPEWPHLDSDPPGRTMMKMKRI